MKKGKRSRILFLSHEASLTGAPIMLLHVIRWLKRNRPIDPVIGLLSGGPLTDQFREEGPVLEWWNSGITDWMPALTGIDLVYANTACHGALTDWFSDAGIPVISHIHEMEGELQLRGESSLQQMVASTDHFIACSNPVAQSLEDLLGISRMNISVIHEAVDIEAVRGNAAAAKLTADSGTLFPAGFLDSEEDWAFAAMGTVTWRKGTDLFLSMAAEVCRKNPRAHGIWIGKVPDCESERLEFELKRLGLRDRVLFTGEQENPHAFLDRADVFCLTSREDPFPLVMIEACALGKTVIGFESSGGVEDFVPFTGGRLVPYLNTAAFAEAVLEEGGRQGSEYDETTNQRMRWVELNLHINAIAPQIDEVLDPMLSGDRPPLSESILREKGSQLLDRLAPESEGRAFLGWDGEYNQQPDWQGPIAGGTLRLEIKVPGGGAKEKAERLRLRVHPGANSACLRIHGWELRNSAGHALSGSQMEGAPQFRGNEIAIRIPAKLEGTSGDPTIFGLVDDDARVFLDIREKDCPELKTATQLVVDLEISHDLGDRLRSALENGEIAQSAANSEGKKRLTAAWPFT